MKCFACWRTAMYTNGTDNICEHCYKATIADIRLSGGWLSALFARIAYRRIRRARKSGN